MPILLLMRLEISKKILEDEIANLKAEIAELKADADARERAAFGGSRETIETYQQEGGYSFNHHRTCKYPTYEEYKARK